MSRAFADICFTPAVKSAQARYGSRASNAAFEHSDDRRDSLTDKEIAFIAARDGFYQATVSETGWPYVQYRGGPSGFLRVLDARTLAYADFRGNVQYISAGNIAGDGRMALILMDYPNRRRLKLWGRARLVDANDDPQLLAALQMPGYQAPAERAVIISLEAYDWNCPKHITPRYSEAEISAMLAPVRAELEALRAENAELRAAAGMGPDNENRRR